LVIYSAIFKLKSPNTMCRGFKYILYISIA
jgi:hypothetical protein